jgi:hypothetical protein
VPGWQLPPPQHPAVHGLVAEQVKLHRWSPRLQPVLAAGQSVFVPHPQKPPLESVSQTPPAEPWPSAIVQLVQAPPLSPHSTVAFPDLHIPPAQQPPLHGCVALHTCVHWCVVVLQASANPQSAALLQPHVLGAPPL